MRTFLLTAFAVMQLFSAVAQKKERFVSAYLSFNINNGLYDRTLTNNAVGFGAGFQAFVNDNAHFKPGVEVNANLFGTSKVAYLTPDNRYIAAKEEVLNIWVGGAYIPQKHFFISLSAGPSFFNNHAYLSIKPSAGYFITSSKTVMAKVSFINIFQRDEISNQSFGYVSFSIGIKLL